MQDELQSWFINNTYQVEQEKPAKLQGAICPENEGGGNNINMKDNQQSL